MTPMLNDCIEKMNNIYPDMWRHYLLAVGIDKFETLCERRMCRLSNLAIRTIHH